jgi:threonine dehydratase
VCGALVDVATVHPWRCPNASVTDRHHVLALVRGAGPLEWDPDPDPFVAFDGELAWAAFAAAHGMGGPARSALVRSLGDAIEDVDGRRFVETPFGRADALSDALGFRAPGGVWVKDETGNVGGSHKARHLMTILLHLRAAEELGLVHGPRPPLAIASCGNAALAAGVLARAARWPIKVFVPPTADRSALARLAELGAEVVVCPRTAGDPPGDPCIHRFRAAVADGAVPFGVQGPENALCLDGGRTLGWEIAVAPEPLPNRLFVQVGGGAFAASVGSALATAASQAQPAPRLTVVQAEGCAPFDRAWRRVRELGFEEAARRWGDCMWPWEQEPASLADGILDDETYDWLGVAEGLVLTGGTSVVANEADVRRACELARATTDVPVSPTGSAGLAGLLTLRSTIGDTERVAVVFSGVARS